MDSFVIKGPCRLEGSVPIGGAKNAMLPLMAASLLTSGTCILENVPDTATDTIIITPPAAQLATKWFGRLRVTIP